MIISRLISHKKPAESQKLASDDEVAHQQTPLEILQSDLEFLVPLLLKFPKCYWLWNHRLWIIQQTRLCSGTEKAIAAWEKELQLVNSMLGRDNRNFHGWNYRRLVTKNLIQLAEERQIELGNVPVKPQQRNKLVEHEFLYTTKMINTNLSNFSAWHQRSRLISILLTERQATESMRATMLDDEFELIESALYTDPYDQSLWFYYQFLMTVVTEEQTTDSLTFLIVAKEDRLRYLRRELDKLQDLLKVAEDCKWIYQALLYYSSVYCSSVGEGEESIRPQFKKWLSQLQNLDPLRKGRWIDLAISMKVELGHET